MAICNLACLAAHASCVLNSSSQLFHSRVALGYVSNRQGEDVEEALLEYGACLVWLQGHTPVNFPDHPYNIQEICKPTDLAEFLQQRREKAARLTKSRQTSRLTLAG